MTTKQQIEAAMALFDDHYWDSLTEDRGLILAHIRATLPAALTAAAGVGPHDDCGNPGCCPDNPKVERLNKTQLRQYATDARQIEQATIERCAQVAQDFYRAGPEIGKTIGDAIAAAIRALERKP